ncbi:MAG TPA: tRNA (adenosine(37)-N6)-dimethylallyltransferase MiaA [Candidatus Acidoferrum sp.]|jgi:tRNA dimethylallyltransferase
MNEKQDSPLVAILGPTASGKSALGIWLAQQLDGDVVACDSTQLYHGFDVGTAKPAPEERGGVAHHLIDVLDASQEATAGDYRTRAIEVLQNLRVQRRLPIFTVGTGLYLRALLEGLADVPVRSEPLRQKLRESAAKRGSGHLHKVLRRLDAAAAKKIAAADEQKLIRAVEVCLLTRKPLTEVYQSGRKRLEGWRAIKIGLAPERKALAQRVNARTETMLARGWVEEVRRLMKRGLHEDAKPFDFIGYRELRLVLENKLTLDAARMAIQQATRRYAKRQMTWFRREAAVCWLEGFGDDPAIQQMALARVREQLGPAVS